MGKLGALVGGFCFGPLAEAVCTSGCMCCCIVDDNAEVRHLDVLSHFLAYFLTVMLPSVTF